MRHLSPRLARRLVLAYAVDPLTKDSECQVLCLRPGCRPDPASPHYLAVPLTHTDLTQLAASQRHFVECDRCHAPLTEVTNGPDPRD